MLDNTPTMNGLSPRVDVPITGIIEVKGKPQMLKTIVIAKIRRSLGLASTNRTPALNSCTKIEDVVTFSRRGRRVNNTKIKHRANTIALSTNTPNRLNISSMTPPNSGPAIRVAFPVAESKAMAVDKRSPDKSPSSRRRIGMSVAQNRPLTIDTTTTCMNPSAPDKVTHAVSMYTPVITSNAVPNSHLRSTRSAITPTAGPHTAKGSIHSIGTIDTNNGEPVSW